jgi:hypothetical protein
MRMVCACRFGMWAALALLLIGAHGAVAADPVAAPAAAVDAALAPIATSPHREVLDGAVSAALRRADSPLAFTISDDFSGLGVVESTRRARFVLRESLTDARARVTFYDGRVVGRLGSDPAMSLSGQEAALASLVLEPARQRLRPTSSAQLDGLRDLGLETRDGVPVRHIQGTIRPEFVTRVLAGVLAQSGLVPSQRTKILAAIKVELGSIDVWIEPSGALWRETAVHRITIDVASLLQGVEMSDGGFGVDQATLELRLSMHPYEVGVPVAVKPPRARRDGPRLPSPGEASDLLTQELVLNGANALDVYSEDANTYASATPDALHAINPNIVFTRGGALAARSQVSLVNLEVNGYTLASRSATGHVYSLEVSSSGGTQRSCKGPRLAACYW